MFLLLSILLSIGIILLIGALSYYRCGKGDGGSHRLAGHWLCGSSYGYYIGGLYRIDRGNPEE